MKRKICVVTGTRAEYGLLYWLMKEIKADMDLQLQIIVTGMHLSPEFGLTYREIEADGFEINAKVEILLSSDTPVGVAKAMGLGLIGFSDALANLSPDIFVVLGDRFEALAAAQAAMVAKIPIAHIHGGEVTEGAVDESIRHAISKMSHMHFTAAEPYRRRVIQLGEAPERVFNVGAPGLDNLTQLNLLNRVCLEESLGFSLVPGPLILCTYHPVTLSHDDGCAALLALFTALDYHSDARVVFTKGNADAGGRALNKKIDAYVAENSHRMSSFTHLGQLRYLSLLVEADVALGNSSSAIIEAPTAQTATVNIGERQKGRLFAPSIISCDESAQGIQDAISNALSSEFQAIVKEKKTFYGEGGGVAQNMKKIMKELSLEDMLSKQFYDVPAPSVLSI